MTTFKTITLTATIMLATAGIVACGTGSDTASVTTNPAEVETSTVEIYTAESEQTTSTVVVEQISTTSTTMLATTTTSTTTTTVPAETREERWVKRQNAVRGFCEDVSIGSFDAHEVSDDNKLWCESSPTYDGKLWICHDLNENAFALSTDSLADCWPRLEVRETNYRHYHSLQKFWLLPADPSQPIPTVPDEAIEMYCRGSEVSWGDTISKYYWLPELLGLNVELVGWGWQRYLLVRVPPCAKC